MKASELHKKDAADIQKHLTGLQQEQFRLRMSKATGQLTQTHKLAQLRRQIARAKTVQSVKGK